MRISDWSSDVCSSDLGSDHARDGAQERLGGHVHCLEDATPRRGDHAEEPVVEEARQPPGGVDEVEGVAGRRRVDHHEVEVGLLVQLRSEEHTSELQSLMSISYAVFCLKKKIVNQMKTV